jgi:molybdopterin-biosynthesis enzyme MoeA-like protein
MRVGLYVIGDEILSGKRADRHLPHLAGLLHERGLSLSWAHFLPDEHEALVSAFRRSLAGSDVVFSCGGIGATPDDHTRQAAAEAAGTDLWLSPQARDLIARAVAKRGLLDLSTPEGERILMMGEFPRGAEIIPNPYNGIPGFRLGEHHFLPGFPVMAWPMMQWVLETRYRERLRGDAGAERSVILYGVRESTITPLMQQIEQSHPGVKTFSLPSVGDGSDGRPPRRHVELGVKGPAPLVVAAFRQLQEELARMGLAAEPVPPPAPAAADQ